jgi:heme o synthase
MPAEPVVTALERPAVEVRRFPASTLLSDYWALTKPEVNFLILITTFAGFYLGNAHAQQQFSFLALLTPLKRKTPLCVLVGAFPGAMPPLIGWAAASGRLNTEVWLLYAVVFLWQFPHFMASAWMYCEDYDRAGYLMLPKGHARATFVRLQTTLPLLALIPISIAHVPAKHAAIFQWTELLLGVGFLSFGLEFVRQRSRGAAGRLLAASIIYLPLWFLLRITFR